MNGRETGKDLRISPRDQAAPRGVTAERPFLLLRYTLIIATAYLLLVERDFIIPPPTVVFLVALALASNVLLASFSHHLLALPWVGMLVILFDTAWITAALIQSGRFSADFFYLYFFVLLLAAIGENLRLIVLGAFVVCAAYLYLHTLTGVAWSFWSSPSLIRIPFLFSVAASYGYLVDRVRREQERASQADRVKSEFLATISHEIRTPINVMIGYADLLLSEDFGALQADQRDAVRQIRDAGQSLYRYISHVLDESRILSRIQTGRDPLRCQQVSLQDLCRGLEQEIPSESGTTLEWAVPTNIPPLWTDGEKLRLVLRNLVENAVKYSPHGSVKVDAEFDTSRDALRIRIADTGAGIPTEDLPHIFEPFYRGKNAERFGVSGTGLGLYLVKQFVGILRGEISVASVTDAGTTFSVFLPRDASTDGALGAISTAQANSPIPASSSGQPAPLSSV